MSLQLLGWAWLQRTEGPLTKLLLLVLAERTPSDYGFAEHEFQDLEYECETWNRQEIRDALDALVRGGLIRTEPGQKSNTIGVTLVCFPDP